MASILFVLIAGLLVGVLVGSGLHTRAIERRYQRVAQLVRELHEREEALAETYDGYGVDRSADLLHASGRHS